jgi:hypothetical protein
MVTHKALRGAACVAVLFGIVACQASPNTTQGFAPYGPYTTAAADGSAATLDNDAIKSSCGDSIHIVVAGIVDCKFHERGYDGMFTLHDHTNGLIAISPMKGDRTTKFTITGVLAGRGYFTVTDSHRDKLRVRVRVTL